MLYGVSGTYVSDTYVSRNTGASGRDNALVLRVRSIRSGETEYADLSELESLEVGLCTAWALALEICGEELRILSVG